MNRSDPIPHRPFTPAFASSRRGFLRTSALAAAALGGLPRWFAEQARAAAADASSPATAHRPAIALIGSGGMGRGDGRQAAQFGRVVAVCDVEVGHRSASICHLGVIALRLGRKLRWDPVRERFEGDREANRFLARPARRKWDLG
jgi:hypothetical protein